MFRNYLFRTTVLEEFLEHEYKDFERMFKEQDGKDKKQVFVETMADCTDKCADCGVIYWKGCTQRCDCTYEKTLK